MFERAFAGRAEHCFTGILPPQAFVLAGVKAKLSTRETTPAWKLLRGRPKQSKLS